MPKINPIDKALSRIDSDFLRLSRRAAKSTAIPVGKEKLTKREARTRVASQWRRRLNESDEQLAQRRSNIITQAGGADGVLDLLGTEAGNGSL